jgi:hypothetical protein
MYYAHNSPVFEFSTCHLVRNAPPLNDLLSRLCPGHSLRHHRFPLLSLLQRLHVRVFFLYLPPYSLSSPAITPLSKSYTRPSHSLPFSCFLSNLWPRQLRHKLQRARWNARTRPGCRSHSVVGASVQPNHISCTLSSGVSYSTRLCDQVRLFLPFCPSIIDPAPQLLPLPASSHSTTVSCVRGNFRRNMQVYI